MAHPGLGTWNERRARRSPTSIALRSNGVELTHSELARSIRSLALELAGDRSE